MLLELDTDLAGVVMTLAHMAAINIHDARRDPETKEDLRRRVHAPPGVGFRYTKDPTRIGLRPAPDRWSSYKVISKRSGADEPIKGDCEDLAAAYAAAFYLFYPETRVEVAIVQPLPGEMAHAFVRVDGRVFDPSVLHGMRTVPPIEFYSTGDLATLSLDHRLCLLPSPS